MKWSDFRGDPYGWAANQAAHVLIGAATVSAASAAGAPPILAVVVGVVVWSVWEAWQFLSAEGGEKRRARDGVMDLLFFAWGFAYTGPEWWPIVGLFAVVTGYVARGGMR